MNRDVQLLLVLTLGLLVVPSAGGGETLRLADTAETDLAPLRLHRAVDGLPLVNTTREEIRHTQVLSVDTPIALNLRPTPYLAASREYWLAVDGAKLAAGVELTTTAPSALVRISPLAGPAATGLREEIGIDPGRLRLTDPTGRKHVEGKAMERLASPQQLARAGVPFPDGTSAFQIAHELGPGAFKLQTTESIDPGQRYLIQVVDKYSDLVLSLQSDASAYFHGEKLGVTAGLELGGVAFDGSVIAASVRAPSGETLDIELSRHDKGRWQGTRELDRGDVHPGALWELRAVVETEVAGRLVRREVKTPFACVIPTARLTGELVVERSADPVVQLNVEAVSAGRYEVRGTLFGTGPDGRKMPLQIATTARWLEPGLHHIGIEFDGAALDASGVGAPFELRDLRLFDQSRMGLLHRQVDALRIDAMPR